MLFVIMSELRLYERGVKMSIKRTGRRNKIKRTSGYRGYSRFGRYRSYSSADPPERSLGKAVAMAVGVVAAASLIIFSCVTFVPRLIDASRRTFISESSEPSETPSESESSKPPEQQSSKPAPESSEPVSEEPKPEPSKPEQSAAESSAQSDNGYDDNGVFIYKNVGYAPFKGSDNAAGKYAKSINSVAATLDTSINVYLMVVPTHLSVAAEKMQKENTGAEKANIKIIGESLSENIKFIDVKDALKEKKDEYIYYNTDERWTSLGAYYAYCRYCGEAGITAVTTEGMKKNSIKGFAGNLVSSTKSDENKDGNPDLLANPDTVEYYSPGEYQCGLWRTAEGGEVSAPFINSDISAENALDVFCYGDVSLFRVYTGGSTGKRLCIVKDGYGSPLAEYFTGNYDEIHVIDARYFNSSLTGYCYNHSITDVLFINGVNNANTDEYTDAIAALAEYED